MIDPKELRVGSYVCNTQDIGAMLESGFNPYFQVNSIGRTGVNAVTVYDEDMDSEGIDYTPFVDEVLFDQLVPISLTPEMLIQCGFIKSHHGFFYIDLKEDDCIWRIISERGTSAHVEVGQEYYKRYSINNIHQLQNLYFALTGEELKISI